MWAEHHCVAPLEQWSLGNEAYFVALDEPSAALDRAYGRPTPTAMDLEWYAIDAPDDRWSTASSRTASCTGSSSCRRAGPT